MGNDVAQSRLAQTRRAKEQNMVKRLIAFFGRSNEYL